MTKREDGNASPRRARRTRRAFTDEFKQEAVQLLRERRAAGVSLSQVARELDVNRDLLRLWDRRVGAPPNGGLPAGKPETPEQELRRLRRENAILRQEREFAKKVAAYFAKESR